MKAFGDIDTPALSQLMTKAPMAPGFGRQVTIRVSTQPERLARSGATQASRDVSLLSITTLVLWLSFGAVGLVGWWLPYPRSHSPAKAQISAPVEALNVALVQDLPSAVAIALPSPNLSLPEPLTKILELPPMPQRLPVSEPSPTIAFALPTAGPAAIREVSPARSTGPTAASSQASTLRPPVQSLVYGQGEGKQPAPDYPPKAMREGQEGTVGVRFSVDPSGRVLEVETSAPSPWRMLNEAALRAVRDRWRFQAGAGRRYEVSIRFELTK